jgi:hydrogenase nickel incorporation protein HypB
MVEERLAGWDLAAIEILFIENVGNLVCPTSWDLGEHLRVALLSVTEGEDKPLKYPGLFNTSDLAVITKIDLAAAVEFDRALALANIEQVRPGMPVLEVATKTGTGIDAWIDILLARRVGLLDSR